MGVDSDTDGVRDDLQRAITFAFPNDPDKRASYMLVASICQEKLGAYIADTTISTDRLISYSRSLWAAFDYTSSSGAEQTLSADDFLVIKTNTNERFFAQHAVDHKVSGMVIQSPRQDPSLMNTISNRYNAIYQRELERQK